PPTNPRFRLKNEKVLNMLATISTLECSYPREIREGAPHAQQIQIARSHPFGPLSFGPLPPGGGVAKCNHERTCKNHDPSSPQGGVAILHGALTPPSSTQSGDKKCSHPSPF